MYYDRLCHGGVRHTVDLVTVGGILHVGCGLGKTGCGCNVTIAGL